MTVPVIQTWSPLAKRVPGGLDPRLGVVRQPWGMCLHTSGRGVCDEAAKVGKPVLDVALRIYLKSQRGELHRWRWGGPTYVIDHGGGIHQLAPDEVQTACAGPGCAKCEMEHPGARLRYLNGTWKKHCSERTLAEWRRRWPGVLSPQHLYPTKSANEAYISVEMLPVAQGVIPRAAGMLFTQAQHDAVVALGRDLAARHGWPPGWAAGSRLVGHEDVQPMCRADARGGWDPGALRERPYFDLGYVREGLG